MYKKVSMNILTFDLNAKVVIVRANKNTRFNFKFIM